MGIYLNEDNSNYFTSYGEELMNEPALRDYIGRYCRGQVKAVFLSPNAQRTSYMGAVLDPIWEGISQLPDGNASFRGKLIPKVFARMARNTLILHEKGLNPYVIWLDELKRRGMQGWISMRMNDLHSVEDPDDFQHDRFWRENPQFWCAPYMGDCYGFALDFAEKEVRDYKLRLVSEYLALFDFMGLELDFLRFPAYFKPGHEVRDAHFISEMLREIRNMTEEAAQKRGHRIKLAARVPSTPDNALRIGLDVLAWQKEALLDEITVSNFWPCTDSDMPMELWRNLLGGHAVINAGLELWSATTEEKFGGNVGISSGFASQYLHRGADNIYLFNHMWGNTGLHDDEGFCRFLDACGERESAYSQWRRHAITFRTRLPLGSPSEIAVPCHVEGFRSFRLNVGGGIEGRNATVIVGLDAALDASQAVELRLNGNPLEKAEFPKQSYPPSMKAGICGKCPAPVLHEGDNVISVFIDAPGAKVVWVEICIY